LPKSALEMEYDDYLSQRNLYMGVALYLPPTVLNVWSGVYGSISLIALILASFCGGIFWWFKRNFDKRLITIRNQLK